MDGCYRARLIIIVRYAQFRVIIVVNRFIPGVVLLRDGICLRFWIEIDDLSEFQNWLYPHYYDLGTECPIISGIPVTLFSKVGNVDKIKQTFIGPFGSYVTNLRTEIRAQKHFWNL